MAVETRGWARAVLIINNLIVSVPSVPWPDCVFSNNCKCITIFNR